jgi:cytochrome c
MTMTTRVLSIVATVGLTGCATGMQSGERGAVAEAEETEEALVDAPVGTVEAQVARGAGLYDRNCDSCHGMRGEGDGMFGDGPPLVGPDAAIGGTHGRTFATAADLHAFVTAKMPKDHPETVGADEAYDVVAYLLFANNVPLTAPLGPESAREVKLPPRRVARRG